MADEKEAAEETQAPKKGGMKGLITYAAIAIVMVTAGYFVGTSMGGSSSGEATEATAEKESGSGGHGGEESGEKSVGSSMIYMVDDVIVNPSGTGPGRFLSVSIGFDVASEESALLLEERSPIIKDALITILGSKTIAQLTDSKEKEITRFQIKKRIENLLHLEDINAVYFTDYILQ